MGEETCERPEGDVVAQRMARGRPQRVGRGPLSMETQTNRPCTGIVNGQGGCAKGRACILALAHIHKGTVEDVRILQVAC